MADGDETVSDERADAMVGDERESALLKPIDPSANAHMRLWRIRAELKAIAKDVDIAIGKSGGYKGRSQELILARVKPLFDRHGIHPVISITEASRNGNMTILRGDVIFVAPDITDIDKDSVTYAGLVGQGTDGHDKGAAKAQTDLLKNAYKAAFQITDVEDESDPVEHKGAATTADVESAQEDAKQAFGAWAASFKDALKACQTRQDVERLQREHKATLTSPRLPDVTRSFFAEEIASLMGELPDEEPNGAALHP